MAQKLLRERRKPKDKIAPEVYSEYLNVLNLEHIRLLEMNAALKGFPAPDAKLSFDILYKGEDEYEDGLYKPTASFAVTIKDEEGIVIAEISATYCALMTAPTAPPPGFGEVFVSLNLSRMTYPFFREVVAGTTAKMDLPALYVPLNIFPVKAKRTNRAMDEKKEVRK